jgi:phosphopantothenoylcysteine synthetase/decarboxylase
VVAPGTGRMACGESGPGRLAEVDELVAAVTAVLPRA